MSERYSRLFTLPENLYAVGSPVVIAAGTLLKDTQTGKIIAQLKLKSISAKSIKAVKVKLDLFDTAGNALKESVVHDYLDLNIARDVEFGQKNPIMVPNVKARSYKVSVTEVVLVDRSVWTEAVDSWEPLSKPSRLAFDDYELQRQYKIKFGGGSIYETKTERDLWCCTCGAINHNGEVCHICHNTLSALQTVDMSALEEEKKARLAEEARVTDERTKKELDEAEKRRAVRKKTLLIGSTLAAIITAFLIITNTIIQNGKYNDAIALINAGNIEEASEILIALDGYKDSRKILSRFINPEIELAGVGDYITFGAYQGKDPIEWLVLDKKGARLLVISRYALTTSVTDSTWETSTLRNWLNGKFLTTAFSDVEQSLIRTVKVSADKNPKYDTNPGKTTQDKVFLLSIAEVEKYFSSDDVRKCTYAEYTTEYAVAGDWSCLWWLRSPGVNWSAATIVNSRGSVDYSGVNVKSDCSVRPALWIDLS